MTTATYNKPLPRPVHPAVSQGFWDACKRHELAMSRCKQCGSLIFYPREVCPRCDAIESWDWVKVSGRGRVYAYTVVYQAATPSFQAEAPYVFAVIELDEGPRLCSNIVGINAEDWTKADMVDTAVEVVFDDVTAEITLPKFRPI